MLRHGPVQSTLDFDSIGKRAGFLDATHSDVDHAFSAIQVPVGVIKGGDGPTLLLSAGSHGDEYEGQVILHRLMQELDPNDVAGRIIMLPALNTPAVKARMRVSPIDQGNMNRSFAGKVNPGPTSAIAAFVSTHLIPCADVIVDFHSGGTATQYVDCGFTCLGPNSELNTANLDLAEVFGAPFTMLCDIDGTGGDFDTAAHQSDTPFLACELGGLGRFSPDAFQIGWDGLQRVMAHLGIVENDIDRPETCFIDIAEGADYITANHYGLAEFHVQLGDNVRRGDPLVTIFDIHNFGAGPTMVTATQEGMVAIVRRNPVVEPGDYLCQIVTKTTRSNSV